MNTTLSRVVVHPLIFLLRHEKVNAHLLRLLESQWMLPEQMRVLQCSLFASIVQHAYHNFSYYRQKYDRAGFHPAAFSSLDDVPRIPILTPAELPALRRTLPGPRIPWPAPVRRRTTGSTGVPNEVVVDADANARSLAARLRAQGWFGLRLGDRQVRFWGRAASFDARRQTQKDFFLNRIRLDSAHVSPARLPDTFDRIRRFRPDYFYGYPSLILAFADYCSSTHRSPGPLKLVICTAETSMDYERRRMAAIFGCPVVNEYGCSEVDMISFTCPCGGNHIPAENIYVEIANPSADTPGMGDVVVTDLHNRRMPLIRYTPGDLASIAHAPCGCGRGLTIISALAGRKACNYVLTPDGTRIHTSPFAYLFEEMAAQGLPIERFKIMQTTRGAIRFYVVLTGKDADKSAMKEIESRLVREATRVLGEGMVSEVFFTEALPQIKATPKFSSFETTLEDSTS